MEKDTTTMTLAELFYKAQNVGAQFSSWHLPLLKDGKPVSFDLEAECDEFGIYHVNIVNFNNNAQ